MWLEKIYTLATLGYIAVVYIHYFLATLLLILPISHQLSQLQKVAKCNFTAKRDGFCIIFCLGESFLFGLDPVLDEWMQETLVEGYPLHGVQDMDPVQEISELRNFPQLILR